MTVKLEAPSPEVKVSLAPPPVIWTDSDEGTIAWASGMRRAAFVAAVREMLADTAHGGRVINVSQKRRGVAVDDLIAFLRVRYATPPLRRDATPVIDVSEAAPDGVDEVLALVGAERVVPRGTPRTKGLR